MSRSLTSIVAFLVLGFAAELPAQTLKIATLAPEGSQWVVAMRAGASEIQKRTDSRVRLKLYAGGVMGNDDKVLRKIRIGQLHGAAFTATSLAEKYPDINIYGMPFLFRDEAEVAHVRERLDDRLLSGLRGAGFETFGFAGGGFARLMSNKPVRTLADLERQKVWVPEGDLVSYAAMKALSLSPVTLPLTDVLTGLQSGLIDIIGSPPVAALVLQWHTKVKYLTELPLLYTIGYISIDRKVFTRLSAPDQNVVSEVLTGVNSKIDAANQADNTAALEALRNAGIQFVEPDPAAVEGWRKRFTQANRDMANKGLVSPQLLDEALALLSEYRDSAELAAAGPTDR